MKAVISFLAKRRKTVAALAGLELVWAQAVVASPHASISAPEWIAQGVAVATALGVHAATNEPL